MIYYMRVANIYTRRAIGLDYRVWLVMLVSWIVCLALYGYQHIKASGAASQPCGTVAILVDSKEADVAICNLDRTHIFSIRGASSKRVEWDFSDGTRAEDSIVPHKYSKEGIYKITVVVDGRCEYEIEANVRGLLQLPKVIPELTIISDSAKTMAGSKIRFAGVGNFSIQSYEWKLVETGETQATEVATFTFGHAGNYTVQLIVNNDPLTIRTKKIDVVELPQTNPINNNIPNPNARGFDQLTPLIPPAGNPPATTGNNQPQASAGNNAAQEPPKSEPSPPEIHEIDQSTFQNLLQKVLKDGEQIDGLYPYLKYKGYTKVEVNGNMPYVNLSEFCNRKRGKTIKRLELIKEKDNPKNVQIIKVKLKGWWPL